MSEQSSQNKSDEIDLGVLFDKIKSLFKSLLVGVVMIFQFFWKHKFVLIGLLVFGLVSQYYFKSLTDSTYVNQFLIKTNYGSTEYLYSKVNSINSKIESTDSVFLKNILGEHFLRVKEIEVVPVIDVYGLVNKSQENKETFKLLLDEFEDFTFIEEDVNVNEYTTHKLKIYIEGSSDNELISNKLYSTLADNRFYSEVRKLTLENLKEQLIENKKIRTQIDTIIKNQNNLSGIPNTYSTGLSFNGSQNFDRLLVQKKELYASDLELIEKITTEDEVLKIIDSTFKVYDKERNPSYILFPLLLVGIYLLIFLLRYLIRNISRIVGKN